MRRSSVDRRDRLSRHRRDGFGAEAGRDARTGAGDQVSSTVPPITHEPPLELSVIDGSAIGSRSTPAVAFRHRGASIPQLSVTVGRAPPGVAPRSLHGASIVVGSDGTRNSARVRPVRRRTSPRRASSQSSRGAITCVPPSAPVCARNFTRR